MINHYLFCITIFTIIANSTVGQDISYSEHIQPLIATHCISCHNHDKIAPIPLTTYDEVVSYARMMEYVVKEKLMPPWLPSSDYSKFKNERTLEEEEIELISLWIKQGFKKGPEKIASSNVITAEPAKLKAQELTFCMEREFEQYGLYLDQYQVFVLNTGLKEDTWIDFLEFLPGNESIVRRCVISVDTTDKWTALDEWDPRYGYYSFGGPILSPSEYAWFSWYPGDTAVTFDTGFKKLLPANSKLIVHIHYGPASQPKTDLSCLKVGLSGKQKKNIIWSAPLLNYTSLTNPEFLIEKDKVSRLHASITVPFDMQVWSIMPLCNMLCRSWEIYALTPNKEVIKLLKIPDWVFNQSERYYFQQPILLPIGTVIHAHAIYDNTIDNPHNPAYPPSNFTMNESMFGEQFKVLFEFAQIKELSTADAAQIIIKGTQSGYSVFNIDFEVFREETLSIYLKDFEGHEIKNLIDKTSFTPGKYSYRVDLSEVPPGNLNFVLLDDKNHLMDQQMIIYLPDSDIWFTSGGKQ